MKDIEKRLVEIDYILKKLDNEYIKKIPEEIWDYIEENKDKNYVFRYDDSKTLVEQNLSIDTISILTYINIEYLLEKEQKKEMIELLRKDEAIAEQEKVKKYNPDNLFKNKKENNYNEVALVEVKMEKWYEKVFSFLRNIFKR